MEKRSAKISKSAKPNINSLEKSSKDRELSGQPITKYIGDYKDMRDFKMKPATEGFIDRLGKALVQWAEIDPQAYKLNQFFRLNGLASEQFYDWTLKYPDLKAAHQYAMRCLGDRREINAMERKIDSSMVLKTLYIYDPTHAQARQDEINAKIEVAKANAENVQRPTQIILGELPGLSEYKAMQQREDIVE